MNDQLNDGYEMDPEAATTKQRVSGAIRKQQRWLNLLTGIAFGFGFVTIIASISLVSGYFFLYRPKQVQILRDLAVYPHLTRTLNEPTAGQDRTPPDSKLELQGVLATMTNAISFGTMLVAVAVGLSAVGTITMLVLIITSRRVTLNQINASLALISNQLRELQAQNSPK